MKRPLENLVVLEFCQYLAGPSAGLRLADMGARVIKIERPKTGDGCRSLTMKNMVLDGDSLLFHTINRNKESVAADLKDPEDMAFVKELIRRADVMTHNFRPGVMEKLGLSYEDVKALNPGIVYGEVTGYGAQGPWRDKPGQDLLVQSLSGLAWLNGNASDPPTPFGLSVVDLYTGVHLAQGILALLVRRERTGRGGHVAVSLLESALDMQFEVITTHLHDGGRLPRRSGINNAHAYLAAPYGIYATADGYLALAMGSVPRLGRLLGCEALEEFTDPAEWFTRRDEIKAIIARHVAGGKTSEWLARLEADDYWCAPAYTWDELTSHGGFEALDIVQEPARENGASFRTTRCPVRIDGEKLKSSRGAPALGEANGRIKEELDAGRFAGWQGAAASKGAGIAGGAEEARAAGAAEEAGPASGESAGSLPLEGLLVLDFSQFLSGPSAALRLADLGARVIKVERPDGGDLCRRLYVSDVRLGGESTIFHAINRNKESVALDLKSSEGLDTARRLIRRADVLIQNFRPGVAERLGLDYESVKRLNPRIVYGTVTGYGEEGPWRTKPGQDLLVQAISGLAYLNGSEGQPPMPMGLSVTDLFAGGHLVQGILACLARRSRTGEGGMVEVSLLESAVDIQFEVFTTYLNDGGELPVRSAINNANAYLGAPYGIYETADGHLALAMGSVPALGELLGCEPLTRYTDPSTWFSRRDEIKRILVDHLKTRPTAEWLSRLEKADYWCSDVLDWPRLMAHAGFKVLDMLQTVTSRGAGEITTTRCPIRIDGRVLKSPKGAPGIGEDTEKVCAELLLGAH